MAEIVDSKAKKALFIDMFVKDHWYMGYKKGNEWRVAVIHDDRIAELYIKEPNTYKATYEKGQAIQNASSGTIYLIRGNTFDEVISKAKIHEATHQKLKLNKELSDWAISVYDEDTINEMRLETIRKVRGLNAE